MNLLQVRQQLRNISGRFDLVTAAGVNSGADFYINEGSKYLDRLEKVGKSCAYHYTNLLINRYLVTFPWCRAVQEVWLANATARWQLEKKDFQWLRVEFETVYRGVTSDAPEYYAPICMRTVPAVEDIPGSGLDVMASMMDVLNTSDHDYNGILILPPTAATVYVEVGGLFYQKELVNDTDENYWTQLHPFLLIQAAMMQIEIANRNTQGVNDWRKTIADNLSGIGMDVVEEEIAEYDQIEG